MYLGENEAGGGHWSLIRYKAAHSECCIPNPAMGAVQRVKQSIKKAVLENPTRKCGEVYDTEVDLVRDTLDDATKLE